LHILTKKSRTWQQDLANVVTDPATLLTMLDLNPALYQEDIKARRLFPMRVPRSFIELMQKGNPQDPLLKQVLPLSQEFRQHPQFMLDPLQEHQTAIQGLLHKYESRVLLMLRTGCAVNCRYCFRRHFPYAENKLNHEALNEAIAYIRARPTINEVILSGGDPLMATDEHLEKLINTLVSIPHLTRLRIHSRLPVVLPRRLTDTLAQHLSSSRLKAILVLHINHPQEIGEALQQNLKQYQAQGITLLNQAVLLQDINNSSSTLIELSEKLFQAGILPYYLHLLDPVQGAAHFNVSRQEALAHMQIIRAKLPGFLVPKLVQELPEQASKTPVFA
jgi:L-lysine 2,3-aminomutase